jgi:hypothetical protein
VYPPSSAPIDRLAPTVRPAQRAVMRQDWHDLLFLHWVVRPEHLRPLIPDALDLDLFEGRAYVGLVPFTMTGVRPETGNGNGKRGHSWIVTQSAKFGQPSLMVSLASSRQDVLDRPKPP